MPDMHPQNLLPAIFEIIVKPLGTFHIIMLLSLSEDIKYSLLSFLIELRKYLTKMIKLSCHLSEICNLLSIIVTISILYSFLLDIAK